MVDGDGVGDLQEADELGMPGLYVADTNVTPDAHGLPCPHGGRARLEPDMPSSRYLHSPSTYPANGVRRLAAKSVSFEEAARRAGVR